MLPPVQTEAAVVGPERAPGSARIEPEVLILLSITLLAAVLRFATLASQSYWVDESQAVHEATISFGRMLSAWNGFEGNPPLYFLLAWVWGHLFGTGEFALRSLSAVAGVALVPLVYLTGRELISRRAGLVAAAFAAVNPFMIWYAQEAREYMLVTALSAASMLFFARGLRSRRRSDLAGWAAFSALALLTQFFAGFLVAAEGLILVWRYRTRASVLALGAMGVIVLALLPHALPFLRHPLPFIVGVPLSLRIQQVPFIFALNTLARSAAVSYGLLGAAAVAAAAIALLVSGAAQRELRGAGYAAILAAAVIIVPLLLALLGHDEYIARAMIPGWVPLAILLAGACTARRAALPGAALAVILLAGFVFAQVKITSDPGYQKVDWKGLAAALGPRPRAPRAIVAYDGLFAAGPLSIYLPGVPYAGQGSVPEASVATVSEVDVIGSALDQPGRLAPGQRLIASRRLDGYRVLRVALARPWTLTPAAIGARAASLLTPAPPDSAVLVQRPGA